MKSSTIKKKFSVTNLTSFYKFFAATVATGVELKLASQSSSKFSRLLFIASPCFMLLPYLENMYCPSQTDGGDS